MKFRNFVVASALLVATAASHAGVVYEWIEIENNMPIDVWMRIEFKESVVQSGSFNLAVEHGDTVIPDTGLISFSYRMMNISPPSWIPTEFGYLYMNLQFVHNNFFMTGSIHTQDWMTRLNTSSGNFGNQDSRVWRIHNTDNDPYTPCYAEPNRFCEGATGYLRKVPEPASIALLGLGAVGALLARRRKSK